MSGDCSFDYPWSPHQPSRGRECTRRWRDQRPQSPRFPSPSLDCGFESDRSSLLTMSSMSSRSDCSDGSRHSRRGRWHREETHMKINLSIFRDEDTKDAVTYQSWRWDLAMYQCAGCRDHTLLSYATRSLQGYPGELVWSSGTDITLDDVLMILDEHYNNVKVLDVLNQELFQLWMADKETIGLGHLPLKAFANISSFLSRLLSPRSCSRTEEGSLLWWTSQAIESDCSLPEGGTTVENVFRLP